MKNKHLTPLIETVHKGVKRPFWSVMITTYNRMAYLEQALISVLEQDPGSELMQIEVVDDCSTETDIESFVKKVGGGRISFYRQLHNIGIFGNWNSCIQRSTGHWIHILHDDDFVLPNFYATFQAALQNDLNIGAAFCRHFYVDEFGNKRSLSASEQETPGILPNWLDRIAVMQRIECPSIVVNRSVYEKLGGFNVELVHSADWEMWKRIAVNYPVWYEPQPLACYRLHSTSDTSRIIKTGENIADIRKCIEISESYLPKTVVTYLSSKARENYAICAFNIAGSMLKLGNTEAAIANIREAIKTSQCSRLRELFIGFCNSPDFDRIKNYSPQIVNEIFIYINSTQRNEKIAAKIKIKPLIIIDSVFFQLYQTGIARVWKSLLKEWAENGFANHIIVLDRAGTAPKIPGINYRTMLAYDYRKTDIDRILLQQICDEEKADIFISTYYTTPISTPSVLMAYDMIPEVMRWNLNESMWREKHNAIRHACAYIAISENTARDLARIYPHINSNAISVAYCGVENTFFPSLPGEIKTFTAKYGISKPYFLIVGGSGGYKNTILFLQAFVKISNKYDFEVVYTGASFISENELKTFLAGVKVHKLHLQDEELRLAYAGAIALVYPSKYEGFGLPVLEALACGCPVITCANASIPEVAGQAAIYVKDDDVDELVTALGEVQKPEIREALITAGLAQAKKFSWSEMAQKVSSVLLKTVESLENTIKIYSQISSQVEHIDRELLQQPSDSPQFLNMLTGCLSLYEIDPFDESVLAELRLLRKRLADFWLNAAAEDLELFYLGNAGKAHQKFVESEFKNQPLTEEEQSFADELKANVAKAINDARAKNYQLAAILYSI